MTQLIRSVPPASSTQLIRSVPSAARGFNHAVWYRQKPPRLQGQHEDTGEVQPQLLSVLGICDSNGPTAGHRPEDPARRFVPVAEGSFRVPRRMWIRFLGVPGMWVDWGNSWLSGPSWGVEIPKQGLPVTPLKVLVYSDAGRSSGDGGFLPNFPGRGARHRSGCCYMLERRTDEDMTGSRHVKTDPCCCEGFGGLATCLTVANCAHQFCTMHHSESISLVV